MRQPELCESDRLKPNPLAGLEIMVSRINPVHIAVTQPVGNLDENGTPQAVPKSGGSPNDQFLRDAQLERRLLIEFFDRFSATRLELAKGASETC